MKRKESSIEKGNILERDVYDFLRKSKDVGVLVGYSEVRFHKKYYNKRREKYMTVDVSIDTYSSIDHTADETPYCVYIFECKNYDQKVDISDIEEFDSKIESISSKGIKGAMVTSVGYPESVIKYAQNRDIALIKMTNTKDFEYILKREINDFEYYLQSLDELSGKTDSTHNIIVYDDFMFTSLLDSLEKNNVIINKEKILNIPFVSDEEINNKVKTLLPVITELSNIPDIIQYVVNKNNIKIINKDLPNNQLGKFLIGSKELYISKELEENTPRYRFTVAHELGHLFLHDDILKGKIDSYGETESSMDLNINVRDVFSKRLEMQANKFAAYLLMPDNVIASIIWILFKRYGINGKLRVDKQPCNMENYHLIVGKIARILNVSKKSVVYRMKDIGVIDISLDIIHSL